MTSGEPARPQEMTELLRRFLSLKPHDDITIERERDDVPARSRILHAELSGLNMEWLRMPLDNFPWVQRPNNANPGRPLSRHGVQSFRFSGDTEEPMSDLYRYGDVILVSRKALACIDRFEPDGFEHVPAEVEGLPSGSYFLIMPNRALDVIDLPRTTVRLANRSLGLDLEGADIFSRTASFPNGYTVRDDIPAQVHLALNTYNAHILMSVELLDCLEACGARGFKGTRTEGYHVKNAR